MTARVIIIRCWIYIAINEMFNTYGKLGSYIFVQYDKDNIDRFIVHERKEIDNFDLVKS
jgi:hypothetical protein